MNMGYVRMTQGLKDNGILIKPGQISTHIKNWNKDYYASIHRYSEKHLEEFRKTGSVAGIKDVKTNLLIFDFDSKDNLELARQDTLELIVRLSEKLNVTTESQFNIYFSGMKGFTVVTNMDRFLTPEQVAHIALNVLGKDLNTLDKSLYNASRILRIPGTKHQESGLYKIPLTYEEFETLSIEDIQKLAKTQRPAAQPLDPILIQEEMTVVEQPITERNHIMNNTSIENQKKPKNWTNCKWSLANGEIKAGERKTALMILAATCKGLSFTKDMAYYICKSALRRSVEKYGQGTTTKEELYNDVIERVYSESWEGGMYTCKKPGFLQTYCESLGEHKCKEIEDTKENIVLESKDLLKTFDKFVKDFDKNRVMTGIKSLDDNLMLTIGQPVGVVAAPSVGKTSLVLNILNYNSKQKVDSMFFSLDMYNALVTQKILQRYTKMDFNKLKDLVLNDQLKAAEYYKTFEEELRYMRTVVKSGITVEEMKRTILEYEKENGIKLRLIIVDYLELLVGPYSDETANSAFNARALRDLSVDLECCVIVLLQPQKTSEPTEPITSYRKIKGASILEQSFRIVLSMYRPGFSCDNPEDDQYIGINCVKNTMGPLFATHLHFEGLTGQMRELTQEEFKELGELKEKLQNQKIERAKDSGGWE